MQCSARTNLAPDGLVVLFLVVACGGGPADGSTRETGGDVGQGGRATGGIQGAGGSRTVPRGETGGQRGVGGSQGSGGGVATGGSVAADGGTGNDGTGGVVAAGGSGSGGISGVGGDTSSDAGVAACKRGIAANVPPGVAFSSSVSWWYDWAVQASGSTPGIEFVPMVWGSGSLGASLPSAARFLLTFNEPNFKSQANLAAAQAASYWPTIESKAAGIPIVGPGMNYCGPADQCNGTDPYQYLKDFFATCADCAVDYVAVHWYNCDLASLRDYLEPGGNLPGFEQFGKPVWLTEFSCDPSATVAEQEAYMRAAIPYLEANPRVYRYAWFSADPIPSAKLMTSDGAPTALGQVYIDLPRSCQ